MLKKFILACKMFAYLNSNENAAGLNGFTVAKQFDANGNPNPMSVTSNNYFMPTAVSCNGCEKIQKTTCTGPFTAA